jgi:hypothetical protein
LTRLPVDQGWTRRHTLFQRMSSILPRSEALGGNCRPEPRHAQPRRTRQKRSSTLRNDSFNKTIRLTLRPRQRESLEHQFPARICWRDGEWQAKMTAWHYTMCKNKTLRWLREMKSRHSTTTDIISPVKDTQVIYALYHISLPRRIYVGQTGKTAFDRFKRHVQDTKAIFRDGIAEGDKATPFHRHMAYVGWQGFRIFPLKRIPGVFPKTLKGVEQFRKAAMPRETFWKRTLHAFMPNGLCLEGQSKRQVRQSRGMIVGNVGTCTPPTTPPTTDTTVRLFASRDTERKVSYLLNSATLKRFCPEDLSTHTTRNTRRMYETLHTYTPETWGVTRVHFDIVSAALLSTLPSPKSTTACQTVVVQLFLHQDLERLGINSVVANESYWNELVPKATRD